MQGDRNLVILAGKLKYAEYSQVTNDYPRFTAKLEVKKCAEDLGGTATRWATDLIGICAWGQLADAMRDLQDGDRVQVTGTLVSRSYQGLCRKCATPATRYWYEVLIDNFVVV